MVEMVDRRSILRTGCLFLRAGSLGSVHLQLLRAGRRLRGTDLDTSIAPAAARKVVLGSGVDGRVGELVTLP